MTVIDLIAEAAIHRDGLQLRHLVHTLLHSYSQLSQVPPPRSTDPQLLSVAAALIELLAQRRGQPAPTWAAGIGPLAEPFFLLEAATWMPRLRLLCQTESPEPLRRRRLFAPGNFLQFA